jgi:hypothetical protein
VKKSLLWFALLGLTAMLIGSLFLVNRRRTGGLRTVQRPTLDSLINVHGSPEEGLKVCGRTFRRVRGAPPYFIEVTNTDLILFSYEPVKGARTLVVLHTNECLFREIPLGEAVFGNQIGYWRATKGQMGDTVESVLSNRMVLLSKGVRYAERSVLDLNSNTIRVVEVQSDRGLNFWTNASLPAEKSK